MQKFVTTAILVFNFLFNMHWCNAQDVKLPLYPGKIPNSKPNSLKEEFVKEYPGAVIGVTIPDISVYFPTRSYSTGQAVIICPGGGYYIESVELEGRDIARYLSSIGITAIVLKYRLPLDETCVDKHLVPLMDAKRAMRMVRSNAAKWNIDPNKIGIMGFSAGGHLASTLGTHFDYGNKSATDSVERQSCRPDFMILMYPVISFADSITHEGSKRMLIGKNPAKELITFFSNELQVSDKTPPAFIVHASNDNAVPVENSLLMYEALDKRKIPAELHIVSEGGHGFGLAANNDHVNLWTNSLKLWLISLNKTN